MENTEKKGTTKVIESIKMLCVSDEKSGGFNIKINIDESELNFFTSIAILLSHYSNRYEYKKQDVLQMVKHVWSELEKLEGFEPQNEEPENNENSEINKVEEPGENTNTQND